MFAVVRTTRASNVKSLLRIVLEQLAL